MSGRNCCPMVAMTRPAAPVIAPIGQQFLPDITYQDDTGFTADGYFENDVLYHGGMVMFREATIN